MPAAAAALVAGLQVKVAVVLVEVAEAVEVAGAVVVLTVVTVMVL